MTIKELMAELIDWLERNQEPGLDVEIDPEVTVWDADGTYSSPILSVEDNNGPYLLVNYPYGDEYECTCGQTKDDHGNPNG